MPRRVNEFAILKTNGAGAQDCLCLILPVDACFSGLWLQPRPGPRTAIFAGVIWQIQKNSGGRRRPFALQKELFA